MPEENKPLYVSMPIRVKTYDIDFVGHVNNIVYIRWLEDLRLHLLDVYSPLEAMRAAGYVPIIVNTEIHYKQGIVLSDHEVQAEMWAGEFGRAVIHLEAQFKVGDEVRATARQRGTFVDSKTMKIIRVPEDFRRQIDGA
jgi:acyl-CoA thioester hydrolase